MSARSIAIVAYAACTFGVALAQAQPSPTPSSPPPAPATAAASPSPTPSDTPSASATASPTPYVRRYFNGRPIDTPEPSASPSVSPGASESPATGPTPLRTTLLQWTPDRHTGTGRLTIGVGIALTRTDAVRPAVLPRKVDRDAASLAVAERSHNRKRN